MKHWLLHTAIFLIAQLIFFALGYSWPWEVLSGRTPLNSIFSSIDGQLWTANTSRIWSIVWLIDSVITLFSLGRKPAAADPAERTKQQDGTAPSAHRDLPGGNAG
ncbi:hypothetical protein [Psychromicrobium lacuslunae]|nr:hypothetical protein [Psychromicrobium lacuslunae]